MNRNNGKAKPFLKWAGGKTQLLSQFEKYYPPELKEGKIKKYFEPFVGSGAVFFDIIQKQNNIQEVYLNDKNYELILVYKTIQKKVKALIKELDKLASAYLELEGEKRKDFFYEKRNEYNELKARKNNNQVKRAALTIFLNKTCFNGLYRTNRDGKFNVPYGRYKNPKILDKENLLSISELLKGKTIVSKDFDDFDINKISKDTFVYFDPPYRPLNKTANFTSYTKDSFTEEDQIRLVGFYKKLNKRGAKLMLSNSDPKNENKNDIFFDEHYRKFNIKRIKAKRMINCDASKRGDIKELVITNYKVVK